MVIETLNNVRFRVPESARDKLPAAKCKLHVVLKGPLLPLATCWLSVLVTMNQMERKAENKCGWAADLPGVFLSGWRTNLAVKPG